MIINKLTLLNCNLNAHRILLFFSLEMIHNKETQGNVFFVFLIPNKAPFFHDILHQ